MNRRTSHNWEPRGLADSRNSYAQTVPVTTSKDLSCQLSRPTEAGSFWTVRNSASRDCGHHLDAGPTRVGSSSKNPKSIRKVRARRPPCGARWSAEPMASHGKRHGRDAGSGGESISPMKTPTGTRRCWRLHARCPPRAPWRRTCNLSPKPLAHRARLLPVVAVRADPATIDYPAFTHICHAFATADTSGTLKTSGNLPSRDLTRRAHQAGVKVLLSVGGADSGAYLGPIACDPERSARFIRAIAELMADNGYDGVDLDLEFPKTRASATRSQPWRTASAWRWRSATRPPAHRSVQRLRLGQSQGGRRRAAADPRPCQHHDLRRARPLERPLGDNAPLHPVPGDLRNLRKQQPRGADAPLE